MCNVLAAMEIVKKLYVMDGDATDAIKLCSAYSSFVCFLSFGRPPQDLSGAGDVCCSFLLKRSMAAMDGGAFGKVPTGYRCKDALSF